jgi:hypothetical protein
VAGRPPDLLLLPRGEGDLDDERTAAAPFSGRLGLEQLPDGGARDGQGFAAGLRRDAESRLSSASGKLREEGRETPVSRK